MMKQLFQVLAVGVFLLLAACSSNKEPASQAIKSAQAAYDAVKQDGLRYAPEKAHAIETALSSARASFDKRDYDTALSTANSVNSAVSDLATAAAARKDQLTQTWADLSNGIPKMVGAIKIRVNVLSKSKKLPDGLDEAGLDGARNGVADLDRMWADATASYQSGNIANAVATATLIKDQAVRIMS